MKIIWGSISGTYAGIANFQFPVIIKLCERISELDWLVFTSPTSILSLFKHCTHLKDKLNPNCRIAVIGPRTGNYLEEYGLEADIIPDNYTAEGLLEVFQNINIKYKMIGIPRTFAAREYSTKRIGGYGGRGFIS